MKKLPWGIIAGICAIVVFFATLGVIAAFVILNAVAAQTGETAALFAEWYQTLLFVLDIVFAVGLVASLVMYFLPNAVQKGEDAYENEAV